MGPRCSVAQGEGGISGNEMVRDGPVHQSACVLRALRTRLIWETCDPACVRWVCVCSCSCVLCACALSGCGVVEGVFRCRS